MSAPHLAATAEDNDVCWAAFAAKREWNHETDYPAVAVSRTEKLSTARAPGPGVRQIIGEVRAGDLTGRASSAGTRVDSPNALSQRGWAAQSKVVLYSIGCLPIRRPLLLRADSVDYNYMERV